MTTDHPNAGPFTAYPKIIAWLTSKKAREASLKRINARARNRSLLASIDRELSLYELAIVTRAGQAKALGLRDKGHLGIGADGDVAVYDLNPQKIDISSQFRTARRSFKKAAYTIKNGVIVVKDGVVVKNVFGRTKWLNVQVSESVRITEDMKRRFKEYWTVEYENYPVDEDRLRNSDPSTVEAHI
jgi:formylmethanofuran dehydrogenase subunit A